MAGLDVTGAARSRAVLVIAGPTGVGKSALAVEISRRVGAEIVSADSRQVYRGIDVGTATPSMAERGGVPHHLLDVVDPGERVMAGWFRDQAVEAIDDIHRRGRSCVVVGGSTLYVHALVAGLSDLPPIPRDLEQALMAEASRPGCAERLFAELADADPDGASTLDPTKTHRLVRLVGLLRSTGRPPSVLWAESQRPGIPARLVVLTRPRDELYRRIDRRVEAMMTEGLLDEVRRLAADPTTRPTLEATIGYRELLPVIDGERGLDEAVRLIQRNSRRYAKRQLTWYRRYDEATWLDAESATPSTVLDAVGPWPAP